MCNKITASQLDILNANCLNACDTPIYSGAGTWPSGTIVKVSGTPPLSSVTLPLYMWL